MPLLDRNIRAVDMHTKFWHGVWSLFVEAVIVQVRDAEFRRHFLLQCLILLQAGSKPASQKPETPQFKIKQVHPFTMQISVSLANYVLPVAALLPWSWICQDLTQLF